MGSFLDEELACNMGEVYDCMPLNNPGYDSCILNSAPGYHRVVGDFAQVDSSSDSDSDSSDKKKYKGKYKKERKKNKELEKKQKEKKSKGEEEKKEESKETP